MTRPSRADDLRLGARIAAMRVGGLALAVRGDPVARLMHRPWRHDPYPVYARLRTGRVERSATGIRAVADHELCTAVLRDRRFGVRLSDGRVPFAPESNASQGGAEHEPSVLEPIDLSLLALDPPDHDRLRRLAQPTFAPRRLEQYRVTAEKITARLLDRVGDFF